MDGDTDHSGGSSTALAPGPREPERGTFIGRYVVLSQLGAGGMGVVYAAYDPELDRKVALKLLRPRSGNQDRARARLQREAQALARLNHVNVVTVHDVGVHEGRVFVAMEFVEGQTLATWMSSAPAGSPRPWTQIVRVFEAAGRGLAAAHEAGLVHRDIKPDNIMLGAQGESTDGQLGRVLVMDFGLARAGEDESEPPLEPPSSESSGHDALRTPLTRTGAMMGTPAYMAPEQFRGGEVTSQSDQFSFCVALFEALYGDRPFAGKTTQQLALTVTEGKLRAPPRGTHVPSWLRNTVRRGLSTRPEDRFPTMNDLLAALQVAETRRRRNRWLSIGAGIGLTVAGGLGVHRYDVARRTRACAENGDAIDQVWNEEAKQKVRAGLIATDIGYAATVADKVVPWIDGQTEAWREHATAACLNADVHETWDAAILDKSTWCLEQARLELAILAAELSGADEQTMQHAVETAASLSPIVDCADESSLARMPEPPAPSMRPRAAQIREQLTRAHYHIEAGKHADALDVARDARQRAETLDWPPLKATAQELEARALGYLEEYEQAEAAGTAAFMLAARSSAWDVAAAAATDLADLVGYRRARHAEGETWADLAAVALTHTTDPLGLREARRVNSLGNIEYAKGVYEEAGEHYASALALFEKGLGPRHPRVAAALNNLGNVHDEMGDYKEAKACHERALAIRKEALGPDHPKVAGSMNNLAAAHTSAGEYAEARTLYEQALTIREAALGAEHGLVGATVQNLGVVHLMLGEPEKAKALLHRSLAIREKALGKDHPDLATGLSNLGTVHKALNELEESEALHQRALAIRERVLGPDHPLVGSSLYNLGVSHAQMGDYEAAKREHERALAVWEKAFGPDHPKVGQPLAGLGTAYIGLGEPQKAIEPLERAIALWREGNVDADRLPSARFDLARALWNAPASAGRDRARARVLAEQARDGFAPSTKTRAEVERWLAEHPLR